MKSIREAAAARAKAAADPEAMAIGERIKKALSRSPVRERQRWSFGFRYFREIKNFGLDASEVDRKWLLSVVYRLSDLSGLELSAVMEDGTVRDGTLRIHDIDWNAKNIPIKQSDLYWIDAVYKGNPTEFPLFQLAVSKAEGRLVGFLDEDNVYQVVLLDPLHNAQPSKFSDYKVRLSKPLGCEVTSIRYELGLIRQKSKERGCGCEVDIAAALEWRKGAPGFAIVMPLVKGTELQDAETLIAEGVATNYTDIFSLGLVAALERAKPTE